MGKGESPRTRTSRLHLAISVFVYGHNESDAPFQEISQTVTINANGCLLELATPVVKDQPLLLTNMKSSEEISCNVATIGSIVNRRTQVGLRFAQPSPRFWGIGFPPEDWDPADRKRPAPMKR